MEFFFVIRGGMTACLTLFPLAGRVCYMAHTEKNMTVTVNRKFPVFFWSLFTVFRKP